MFRRLDLRKLGETCDKAIFLSSEFPHGIGSKLKKRIKVHGNSQLHLEINILLQGTSSSKGMYMRRIIGRAIVKSDFIPSAQQEKFLKLKVRLINGH